MLFLLAGESTLRIILSTDRPGSGFWQGTAYTDKLTGLIVIPLAIQSDSVTRCLYASATYKNWS